MTTEEGVDLDPMTSETGYSTDQELANEKGLFSIIFVLVLATIKFILKIM